MNPVRAKYLISDIKKRQSKNKKLTRWENAFIKGILDRISEGRYLTVDQAKAIKRIGVRFNIFHFN